MMTKGGTFVINGAERVIVSPDRPLPGVYYARNAGQGGQHHLRHHGHPYRGAWLEYETDLVGHLQRPHRQKPQAPRHLPDPGYGPQDRRGNPGTLREEPLLVSTLEKDTCKTWEEALLEIYRKLRPGEPPTLDSAETLINGLFFDARRYDLSAVGRYKFNKKLALGPRLSGQKLAAPWPIPAPVRSWPRPGRT